VSATVASTQDVSSAALATESAEKLEAANGTLPAAAAAGKCEMNVTGDIVRTVSASTDGRLASDPARGQLFSTRHWMTEAQVAAAAAYQADAIATIRATVAASGDSTEAAALPNPLDMMKDWSPIPWFMLNCSSPDDRTVVVRFSNMAAGPDDIAMAPAAYTIPAGFVVDETGSPNMALFFPDITTRTGSTSTLPELWGVTAPGKFEITRFDDEAVAGNFTFDAGRELPSPGTAEPGGEPHQIHVDGNFEFQCVAEGGCGQK
jgi:hypothetical protein